MGKTPCEFMLWTLRQVVKRFISKKYDWIFVDEAQDPNKTQFKLIKMICNGKTRIIAVLDLLLVELGWVLTHYYIHGTLY